MPFVADMDLLKGTPWGKSQDREQMGLTSAALLHWTEKGGTQFRTAQLKVNQCKLV